MTKHKDTYAPHTPPPAPAPVVVPAVVPQATPSAPQAPQAQGGTQVYCSSPTAPGWQVGVPGGGCNTTTTVVHLNEMPYTGVPEVNPLAILTQLAVLLVVAFFIRGRLRV